MSNLSHLTTKEVARLFRVSDATVKRWEDAGLIVSERTGGGHRRFRAEEVARFQRAQGLGFQKTKNDEAVLRTVVRQRENKKTSGSPLFNALIEGNEEQAVNLILGEYLQGTPVGEIFDLLITRAMFQIGELWYAGELSITQEHLATRIIYAAIHKLRSAISFPESNGKIALCCSGEGDLHELPAYLAQIILENIGWEVINFGANTPLYSLTDEVAQYKPNLICISAKTIPDVERFSREYRAFRAEAVKMKVPIALGGSIFDDSRVKNRFEAELFPKNFTDLENFAKSLSK